MIANLLNSYPSAINWMPLALMGFWTHQIFIWMGHSEERQKILDELEEEHNRGSDLLEDGNEIMEKLSKDSGRWLYLWTIGVGAVIGLRFLVSYFFIK